MKCLHNKPVTNLQHCKIYFDVPSSATEMLCSLTEGVSRCKIFYSYVSYDHLSLTWFIFKTFKSSNQECKWTQLQCRKICRRIWFNNRNSSRRQCLCLKDKNKNKQTNKQKGPVDLVTELWNRSHVLNYHIYFLKR